MSQQPSRHPRVRIGIRAPEGRVGVMARANLALLEPWIRQRLPWVGEPRVFREGDETIIAGEWDASAIETWWGESDD